jgi:hypothetical protein
VGKKNKAIDFDAVVKNRKLPILTLDSRWHELFPEEMKTSRIKELEQEVNNLLKKQGKLTNDIKDMKKLKKSLLKDIVVNMDIGTDLIGRQKEKKLDKNKQYINDLNDKIDKAMDDLADLPYQIKEKNELLMAESMKIWYKQLEENKLALAEIGGWIAKMREELKLKILAKQDMESKNKLIYTYMHDIMGAGLMEAFDKENNSEEE